MPSSDPQTIPKVLKLVDLIQPRSILDIGCGNGRYGFLFREVLDLNYGRMLQPTWEVVIDGVEVEPEYITNVHNYVYNVVHRADWLEFKPNKHYDLIFMGDVLEHFSEGEWQKALYKARVSSNVTIIVCPNWDGSIAQGAWHGHESERHKVSLTPQKVGGRCLFANSKTFIAGFDNNQSGVLEGAEACS